MNFSPVSVTRDLRIHYCEGIEKEISLVFPEAHFHLSCSDRAPIPSSLAVVGAIIGAADAENPQFRVAGGTDSYCRNDKGRRIKCQSQQMMHQGDGSGHGDCPIRPEPGFRTIIITIQQLLQLAPEAFREDHLPQPMFANVPIYQPGDARDDKLQWAVGIACSGRRCMGDHQHFSERCQHRAKSAVDRAGHRAAGVGIHHLVFRGPQDWKVVQSADHAPPPHRQTIGR